MNDSLCWRVLFAPYCGSHGTSFSVDSHDIELFSTRSLDWNYVKAKNIASLVGTLDMHYSNLVFGAGSLGMLHTSSAARMTAYTGARLRVT